MELETAARKWALASDAIRNLVADRVWKFELEEPLEGTGNSALVLYRRGGWTKPLKSSQEFPILVAECWSDHSRAPDGEPLFENARERCMQLAREVDRRFHLKDREHVHWGDLYVMGSFRGSEPTNPEQRAGVWVVRSTFDVQTFHEG